MKKLALVFVLAVLMPSLVLAWLAVRSLRDQQVVLERQRSLLYQSAAASVAKDVLSLLMQVQGEFGKQVETLLVKQAPHLTARSFDDLIQRNWPLSEIGFAVSLDGQVLSPSLLGRPAARRFRLENDQFLTSRETADIYWNSPKGPINLTSLDDDPKGKADPAFLKKTAPTKDGAPPPKLPSKISVESCHFVQLVINAEQGMFARFLQDQLKLLVWHRSPLETNLVFGAQLNLTNVIQRLTDLVRVEDSLRNEVCVALLDDRGQPVARSHADFQANWKRPFESAEIGELLPHWEVGVYLLNPAKFGQAVHTARLTLGLLIGMLLLAILVGGWLIGSDLRRELTLARQKTDFVSNVSHELKTPLTSIRMFAELLAEGRVADPAKNRTYLNIITAEAARLTRLINNVLDFARLERGEMKYNFQRCDLAEVVRETVETYRPHLESAGFTFTCAPANGPLWVHGDRDALSQVLVNLLSNAEKYSGERKEIEVQVECSRRNPNQMEVRVLDRGLGVPRGSEEKIFEQFYRAHDALNSGIQGSGLGLTLARQIARAHSGDVLYGPRADGGSCFVLTVPLVEK
jgi:signal transduction histidine kinase